MNSLSVIHWSDSQNRPNLKKISPKDLKFVHLSLLKFKNKDGFELLVVALNVN